MKLKKRQTLYQYSVIYFLILFLSSTLTKLWPGAGVIAVWCWFLIPGYLLTFFSKRNLAWYTRLPFALGIGVGLFSPITIIAILLRLNLNFYLGLFILTYIFVALVYYFFAPELNESQDHQVDQVQANWPFLALITIIIAGLVYLSLIWPLAGDDLAGLPIYSEVLSQGKILGTEPFHGTGTPVTPRNELVVQGYQMIMLAKVGDLIPNDLFIFSRSILIVFSFLAIYNFITEWYKDKKFAQLSLVVWGIYLLGTLHFDKDGSNFVTRIYQDKFSGWFVVIPILLTLFIWYIRDKDKTYLVFLGIGSLGLALTHPVTFMILLLLVGSYSILHLGFNWSKEELFTFFWIGVVLVACLVIPVIQYIRYMGPMPIDTAGLSDAVTYSRSFMAVNRYRLLYFDDGSYILHPSIITQPLVLAGLILSIFLVPETRRKAGTRLAVSAMVIISVVLYTPILANIMGKIATPYLLWRLAWPYSLLSILIICEASIRILDLIANRLESKELKNGLRRYKEVAIIFAAVIIAIPSFQTGTVQFNQRISEITYSPCTQAQGVLSEVKKLTAKQSLTILASSKENLCVPGAAGLANVVEYRGLGTVNRLPEDEIETSFQRIEDINIFTNATMVNMQIVRILETYAVDYILIDRDRTEFELQLLNMSQSFKKVYTDENYALYQVENLPKESLLVAGNEALRLREWDEAKEYFLDELEADKNQPLAYLGLAHAYAGEGNFEESLDYLMLAQLYAPTEAEIYSQISETYLLLQDLENSITNLEKAVNIAPDRGDFWISLGTLQYYYGEENQARDNLEKGFALQAKNGSVRYLTNLANHLTRINWETEAIQNFKKALSITADPAIYTNYATSLAQMNERTEAIQIAQQATKLSRWDYRPFLLLGQIYQEMGNFNLASEMYLRVLALNPFHSYAYTELAQINQETEGYTSALEYMQAFEESNSALPGPHAAMATLYLMQGDTQNALEEYEIIQKIMPRNASLDTIMGYLNLIAEDYEEANKLFTETLDENPQSVPSILGLAKIYSIKNDPSQEIGLRYQVVKENPLAIWPHISLARTFSRLGNWQKAENILTFSINLNPNEESAWVMVGDFYMARADWTNAQLAYFEAQNLDPNNPDILIRMGKSYWYAGNLPAATRYFEEAIARNTNLNEAYLALANVLWLDGSIERSKDILDEMLIQNQITIADLSAAINLYERQGRLDKAEELYNFVFTSYSKLSNTSPQLAELDNFELNDADIVLDIEESLENGNVSTAQILLQAANFFNKQGKWETAKNALLLARSLSPETPSIYIAEAEYYRMRGESAQAETAIKEAPDNFPNSAEIYLWLANIALGNGDITTAQEHLAKSSNLDSTLLETQYSIANIYRTQGDFDSALSLLEETYQKNPASAEALQKLIELKLFIGENDEAETLLQDGIVRFPTNSSLLGLAADFYLQMGDYSEAEQHYQKAVEVNPDNIEAYLTLGKFFEERERITDALATFQKAVDLDQSNAEAKLELSRSYINNRDEKTAIEILENAILSFPGIASFHDQLGEYLYQSLDYENSLDHYSQACELDKTNVNCLIGQGQILLQQNNSDSGENLIKSAIETAPASPDAYLVLADFYQKANRNADAEKIYKSALQQTLNKSVIYSAQAGMHLLAGDITSAEEAYLAGWSYSPTSVKISLELINFYKQQNSSFQTQGIIEKITVHYPELCEFEVESAYLHKVNLNLAAAEQTYLDILEKDPLCVDAYEGLSTVYNLLGKTGEALQVHQDAVMAVPNHPLAFTRLGDYYFNAMLFEDAQAAYESALKLEENNLDALLGLEKISLAQTAETDYSPTLLLEYAKDVPPQKAADLALGLQEFYQWDQAYSLIQKALEFTPYNGVAWYALGNHYQHKMNYDEALLAYQNALRSPATQLESLLEISNLYVLMDELELANSTIQETLTLYPGSIEPYLALSEFFIQTDQTEIAEEILLEGIAEGPKDVVLYETLAAFYLDNNDPEQAEEMARIGLENYPGSAGLYTTLGDIYSNGLADLIDQVDNYNAYLWWYQYLYDRIQSQRRPENIRRQQFVSARLRNIEEEIQTASQGLKSAQNNLTDFQINIDKAQEAYQSALSIDPSNATALLRLGRLASALETNTDALPYYQGAISANPNSVAALKSLGFAYLIEGEPQRAVPLFERSITIDPTQTVSYMGKFRATKESNQDGILLGSELTEMGQFWYGNLIDRFRVILEADYDTSTTDYSSDDYAEVTDAPALDIPSSWQMRQSSFEHSDVTTYTSPDDHAVIQMVIVNDGSYVTRTFAFEIALALLQETYGSQIDITRNEILDDRENLIWTTPDNTYAGVTGFTISGNDIVILTSMYDLPYAGEYQELLTTISNQVQLGDLIYAPRQ